MENILPIKPIELERINKEKASSRMRPSEEMMFYRAVASGDIRTVEENCNLGIFKDTKKMGHLSDDPVTNLKYHYVVTVAMLARFCMESGMSLEEAYSLSDYYILQMDRCEDLAGVVMLHDKMVLDYTGRMRMRRKQAAASRQVSEAIDYIYDHISERITVEDLAQAIYISPAYLSRIFKQEVGISVSDFIRERKIYAARNLLSYTDYEYAEIASMLSYSSQSHFIQQFRKAVGMTPKAYREKNYMNAWKM